jgi:D-alanyl-D-alanine carboxypeptidase
MNKFLLFFFCLVFFFALSSNAVFADAQQKASIRLDANTLSKGYTLSNEDFSLGIQPNTFSDPAKVYFRNVKKRKYSLPENLNLISSIYKYNVRVPNQSILPKVIWLSLKYDSKTHYKKDLYFLNGQTGQWQKLLSSNDKDDKTVLSGWWFPYSVVAVFEDPSQLEEPIKKDSFSSYSETLDAASAIVIDEDTGKILFEKNANEQRSLASLTKMMTALIFLESETSMDNVIAYNSANDREGARLYVENGETMTVKDVFYTMLVGSANNCALTLADSTGLSREDFVNRMNQKAFDLDLTNTHFDDPSGLEVGNMTSASDYAKLMQVALDYSDILTASTSKNYSFYTINTNIFHDIKNTNMLLDWDLYITGGKTGYINEALYCLMIKAKEGDHEVITVLLGNPSSYDRFVETYSLTKWALTNYTW